MELKEISDSLDRIEGKMKDTSEANKAELKRLGDEQVKLSRQLIEVQQNAVKAVAPKAEVKTAGALVAESAAVRAFIDGSATKARMELAETKATATDPIVTPTGGVQAYRRPGVLAGAFRPFTIEALFPNIPVASNAYEYVKEKDDGFVNGAAPVAEGAQKPFGSTGFELISGTIKTVAHLARISKQLMEDAPALEAYINQRIVYGVDLAVEDQITTGDGNGQNLSGIFTSGNYTPHAAKLADLGTTNATLLDLILFAKTKVEQNYFRPNAILMNPLNWSKLQMLKNGSADYYLTSPASIAQPQLWGLPVVTTQAVAVDTFMVGDFSAAGTVWTRTGMTVELFEQDSDNVEKNLITIRAERRLGFGIERPGALCGGALTVPSA